MSEKSVGLLQTPSSVEQHGLCSLRPVLIIGSFMLLATLEGMWESMIAPVWPVEAREVLKINEVEKQLVFSCFQLAVLFSSPLFGFYGHRIGRQKLVYFGIALLCAMSFLFGWTSEFSVIFLARFTAGIGSAALWSSGFSLIAFYFPTYQSTVMGLIETAMGIGFMIGSPVGVFLYNATGEREFWIPFSFCGGMFFLSLFLLTVTLPKSSVVDAAATKISPETDPLGPPETRVSRVISPFSMGASLNTDEPDTSKSVRRGSLQRVGQPQSLRASKLAEAGVTLNPPLRRSHWATGSAIGAGVERMTAEHRAVVTAIAPEEQKHGSFVWVNPTTLLTLFSAFMIQLSWSSFQSNMEPFLSRNNATADDPRSFNLEDTQIALVLTAGATVYGICAPISGRITARFGEAVVMSIGCVVSGLGLLLTGPVPFIDTTESVHLHVGVLIFSVCLLTTGVGMVYVPALGRLLISIKYLGSEEADRLTGVVSGVFYACATTGGALGPMLSLALMSYGIPWILGVAGFIMLGLAPLNFLLNEHHTKQHMQAIAKVGEDLRSSLGFSPPQHLIQTMAPLDPVTEGAEGGRAWDEEED